MCIGKLNPETDLTRKNTKLYVKILHADFADYADFNPCKIRLIRESVADFNRKGHKKNTRFAKRCAHSVKLCEPCGLII
ncbi:hypothetical protein C8P67_106225 [Flavobacterium aquicola]|uniref:Uncharacterized protein n=1 Tax=Flavobacterium aquicola TaxID=1682742 RepID=A0A3E0EN95_9FLAO|nr:hypothetical protein C8P67_106225 [Flavobacterium aquicola]